MCTKKELVEWLEANVPDDAVVLINRFYPDPMLDLDLNNTDQICYVEEVKTLVLLNL